MGVGHWDQSAVVGRGGRDFHKVWWAESTGVICWVHLLPVRVPELEPAQPETT